VIGPEVERALAIVSREAFTPVHARSDAKSVALVAQAAGITPGSRVLEVGTGAGYQTAVLVALGAQVYTIERVAALAELARARLPAQSVQVRMGDGRLGWPEAAPFDVVLLGASAPTVPPALLPQVGPGGRLVAPLGSPTRQQLVVLQRMPWGRFRRQVIADVLFEPLAPAQDAAKTLQ